MKIATQMNGNTGVIKNGILVKISNFRSVYFDGVKKGIVIMKNNFSESTF